MVLSYISLRNFRKHLNTHLDFSSGLNYIIGGNGEGKTSVLEGIYYLCTTKSFGSPDASAVNFGEEEFEVSGRFEDKVKDDVKLFYRGAENKKFYFLNGKQISRASEVIGKFPVVVLAPSDHYITQEGPSERRKFVDSVLSQASETYLQHLLEYNRILRQRSALLGRIRDSRTFALSEELEAWNSALVSAGSSIIKKRIEFITEFIPYVSSSYGRIMGAREVPAIRYAYLEDSEGNEIDQKFKSLIMAKRDEELRRGLNLAGPHRDEFVFDLDGLNLKTYGSQGQHKTFQVVLRFAEFFYLKEKTGKTPVFMLDDVFGELDAERSKEISSYLREVGQAFVTLTDFTNINIIERKSEDRVIRLKEGAVANA